LNLLTIDDDYDTTEAVTDYCKIRGIDCKVANKGRQGLFEIQKREYDLILLDIAMPEFTGFDILSQLKKQGVRYKTIVIFTAWRSKMEDFKDYTEVGVREIVKKPVEMDHLDNIVKSYLMNVMQTDPNGLLTNQ
jgi:two-component system, OmpR family, response regulator